MALALARGPGRPPTLVYRPSCPQHPHSRVQLDGHSPATWTDQQHRPRYRCMTPVGSRGHVFSLPVSVRQPTEEHPDSGAACASCEHTYERHEGLKTGHHFVFAHKEIAQLLIGVGELKSLREASKDLRIELERVNQRAPDKTAFRRIAAGQTSKQANLAVNYVDAYAPTIVDALLPKVWPKVVAVDSTTMMTRGYRPISDRDLDPGDGEPEWAAGEKRAGDLKAGTIMSAVDHTGPEGVLFLIQAQGGKDTESWRRFFLSRSGAPDWVIADLDPAIARAVREVWPNAVLFHSGYHIRQLLRKWAKADGIPNRVKLDQPVPAARRGTGGWSTSDDSGLLKYGPHPLMEAIDRSQRGPTEWAELLAAVEKYISPDKLALRSWIATNELLIERQREIIRVRRDIPRSTGSLEGKIDTLLDPLKKRAGRWKNVRRLNLVLGLATLRARGDAREARYAKLIREHFLAQHNLSHAPADNHMPIDPTTGLPMSWWRKHQDRGEASLPLLVRESTLRTIATQNDATARRRRERLAAIYAEHEMAVAGGKSPARGRPKRPDWITLPAVRKGLKVADIPELLDEWAWDFNLDLDPRAVPASSKLHAVWRCALNPAHVWAARVSSRALGKRYCPYHMRTRVHPSESLAALDPPLALEWHSSAKGLRPDQVSFASAEMVTWRCVPEGHEWKAPVYARTRGSGCPMHFAQERSARTKVGLKRSKAKLDDAEREKLALAIERELQISDKVGAYPVPDQEDF